MQLGKLTAIALLCAPTAHAFQTSQFCYSQTIPPTTTNWMQTLTLPRADPADGVLTRVDLTLSATLSGSASVESPDFSPQTVQMNFAALVSVDASGTTLDVLEPSREFTTDLSAFDGTIDFAGTSGAQFPGLVVAESSALTYLPGMNEFALFLGPSGAPGTLDLDVQALGQSFVLGVGGLIVAFQSDVELSATVCYTHAEDCNGNGIADVDEVASGGITVDFNDDGIPDDCQFTSTPAKQSTSIATAPMFTNWVETLPLPRFDPELGELLAVEVRLTTTVDIDVELENLEAFPATLTVDASATVSVPVPNGPTLFSAPSFSQTDTLPAFDGTLDFAGPSSLVLMPPALVDSNFATLVPPVDLSPYVGPPGAPGTLDLDMTANGLTQVTGAVNVAAVITVIAQGEVEIEYCYTPDCNQNGVADDLEIFFGESDCDEDGVLDACQLDALTDMDNNGVLDECEVVPMVRTVCFSDSLPSMLTSWNDSATVPRFDPDLGTLVEVTATLTSTVQGSVAFENLDTQPASVSTQFQALVELRRPDASTLTSLNPNLAFVDNVTAFDGTIDFAGSSGMTYAGLSNTSSRTYTTPPGSPDLALFTGPAGSPGTLTLPVLAQGLSTGFGGSNTVLVFMQSADAEVEVCYTYVPACEQNGIADGCDGIGINRCNGDGGDQLGCTDCPCSNNAPVGTIGGCLNQTGNSAVLAGFGSASVSAVGSADLRFRMAGGNPGSLAVLVSGEALAPQNAANPCFGTGMGVQSAVLDGLRCAIQNTRRHGGRVMDGSGDVGLTNNGWGGADGPQPSLAAQGGFVAGQTRYFQVFYRADTMLSCMTGQNTTQAVEITYQP